MGNKWTFHIIVVEIGNMIGKTIGTEKWQGWSIYHEYVSVWPWCDPNGLGIIMSLHWTECYCPLVFELIWTALYRLYSGHRYLILKYKYVDIYLPIHLQYDIVFRYSMIVFLFITNFKWWWTEKGRVRPEEKKKRQSGFHLSIYLCTVHHNRYEIW